VCVLLWILRFSDLANTLPHPGKGQGNGFSPVWTRIWFTSLYFALNGLPFLGQLCQKQACVVHSGPPTCSTVRWVTISCIVVNVLPHVFLGTGCSGSIHMHDISCLTGCRIYLKNAPWWVAWWAGWWGAMPVMAWWWAAAAFIAANWWCVDAWWYGWCSAAARVYTSMPSRIWWFRWWFARGWWWWWWWFSCGVGSWWSAEDGNRTAAAAGSVVPAAAEGTGAAEKSWWCSRRRRKSLAAYPAWGFKWWPIAVWWWYPFVACGEKWLWWFMAEPGCPADMSPVVDPPVATDEDIVPAEVIWCPADWGGTTGGGLIFRPIVARWWWVVSMNGFNILSNRKLFVGGGETPPPRLALLVYSINCFLPQHTGSSHARTPPTPPLNTSHTSLSLRAPNSTRCLNLGNFNDENIRPTYLQIWTPPKNVTTTIISDKNTFWSQAHMYPRHCTVLPPGVSQWSRKQEQKSVAHKSWYATVWFRILSGTEHITQPSLYVSKQQRSTATEGVTKHEEKKQLEGGESTVLPFANWAVDPLQVLQGPLRIGERLESLLLVT